MYIKYETLIFKELLFFQETEKRCFYLVWFNQNKFYGTLNIYADLVSRSCTLKARRTSSSFILCCSTHNKDVLEKSKYWQWCNNMVNRYLLQHQWKFSLNLSKHSFYVRVSLSHILHCIRYGLCNLGQVITVYKQIWTGQE